MAFRRAYEALGEPTPVEWERLEEVHYAGVAEWAQPARPRRYLQLLATPWDPPAYFVDTTGKGYLPVAQQRRRLVLQAQYPARRVRAICAVMRLWIVDNAAEIVVFRAMHRLGFQH